MIPKNDDEKKTINRKGPITPLILLLSQLIFPFVCQSSFFSPKFAKWNAFDDPMLALSVTFFLQNQNIYSCKPFPKQALVFICLQYKSFENTVGKGKTAHTEQFLLFP